VVALVDADERAHGRCLATFAQMTRPPVTTWPAIAEAMHLVARRGWRGRDALWQLMRQGTLVPRDLTAPMQERCYELMSTYRDLPMAFADASLVALAETER